MCKWKALLGEQCPDPSLAKQRDLYFPRQRCPVRVPRRLCSLHHPGSCTLGIAVSTGQDSASLDLMHLSPFLNTLALAPLSLHLFFLLAIIDTANKELGLWGLEGDLASCLPPRCLKQEQAVNFS